MIEDNFRALTPAQMVGAISAEEDGTLTVFGTPLAQLETNDRLAIRGAALAMVSQLGSLVRAVEGSIDEDMAADGATELYHPDYEITRAPRKVDPVVLGEVVYAGLTALAEAGKLPPAQVAKAVSRVETVEYKVNRTHLKPLLKFGAEVERVVKAGIVEGEPGPPVLRIIAKAKPR